MTRFALLTLGLLTLAGCPNRGVTPEPPEAISDGGSPLEAPGALPRPPTGKLPAELLPPGMQR